MIIVHTLLIPNNITSNNSKVYKNLIQESLSFSLKKGDVVFPPYQLFITIHCVRYQVVNPDSQSQFTKSKCHLNSSAIINYNAIHNLLSQWQGSPKCQPIHVPYK